MKFSLKPVVLFIAVILTITISGCAQPNWYKAGKWNYTHQNYDQALPQLLWSAQLGDASAQYAVGYMYYNGLGTPKDDIQAYHWFTKASAKGNENAAIALKKMEGLADATPHHPIPKHNNTMKRVATHPTKSVALPILPAPIKTN